MAYFHAMPISISMEVATFNFLSGSFPLGTYTMVLLEVSLLIIFYSRQNEEPKSLSAIIVNFFFCPI